MLMGCPMINIHRSIGSGGMPAPLMRTSDAYVGRGGAGSERIPETTTAAAAAARRENIEQKMKAS